jgi:hypothetical protein
MKTLLFLAFISKLYGTESVDGKNQNSFTDSDGDTIIVLDSKIKKKLHPNENIKSINSNGIGADLKKVKNEPINNILINKKVESDLHK